MVLQSLPRRLRHLDPGSDRFVLDWRAPSPRVRFPTPIAPKVGPMPPNQRFRLDNRNDRQDRWKPSIHLDEEPAVVVGRLSATPHPAPQDDQLMSEHRILRLKPALRLERRGQHGQNKTEQPDHSASLGDSIRSSTQIRFSVHTGLPDPRTLSPCNPIFFYYTAILWTGLHGVLAAVRPDG